MPAHSIDSAGVPIRVREVGWLGAERIACELRAAAAGCSLPMYHRSQWASAVRSDGQFFVAEGLQGQCLGAMALETAPSRALPGSYILRVQRFGPGVHKEACAAMLAALRHYASVRPRVLRLHVELYSLGGVDRLADAAVQAGFRINTRGRCYDRTSVVSLGPPDDMFARLHATARQNVRAISRHPVEVRLISDCRWIPRLDELLSMTLRRTGGKPVRHPWEAVIAHASCQPRQSRIAGLFWKGVEGPSSLLAFAWGCMHGDHAHYSTAASARLPDLRISLGYALVWDLMQWAHSCGGKLFDLGGITTGSDAQDDPLAGISRFKRFFKGKEIVVGMEVVYEPNPVMAWIAGQTSRLQSAR
jgi:hypothetical protein